MNKKINDWQQEVGAGVVLVFFHKEVRSVAQIEVDHDDAELGQPEGQPEVEHGGRLQFAVHLVHMLHVHLVSAVAFVDQQSKLWPRVEQMLVDQPAGRDNDDDAEHGEDEDLQGGDRLGLRTTRAVLVLHRHIA